VLAEVFGDHLITFDARFRTVASAARSVAESVLPLITELAAFGQAQWPDPDCLPKIFKKYSQRMMDAHVAFAKVYADGVFGGIGVAPMVLSTISDDPDPSDAAATKGTAIRCHSWDLFDFMSLPVCHLVEQELCWQDQPSPFSADILRAITPAADAVVTAASHSMSTMILDGLSLKFRLQPRSTFVNHSRHFLRASGPDPVLADVFVFSDSIVIFEANAPRKVCVAFNCPLCHVLSSVVMVFPVSCCAVGYCSRNQRQRRYVRCSCKHGGCGFIDRRFRAVFGRSWLRTPRFIHPQSMREWLHCCFCSLLTTCCMHRV
jgi:hypothetical protein